MKVSFRDSIPRRFSQTRAASWPSNKWTRRILGQCHRYHLLSIIAKIVPKNHPKKRLNIMKTIRNTWIHCQKHHHSTIIVKTVTITIIIMIMITIITTKTIIITIIRIMILMTDLWSLCFQCACSALSPPSSSSSQSSSSGSSGSSSGSWSWSWWPTSRVWSLCLREQCSCSALSPAWDEGRPPFNADLIKFWKFD